jgi:CBS domain containing-hemolysin-like protein
MLVDEYGGTAGIVTLQDLLGALVGRIEAEQPFESSALAGQQSRSAPDGSLLVDGLTRLSELEDLLGIRVDEELRAEVDTVGGPVMLRLGSVPAIGDQVGISSWLLRVEALDGHRAAAVRIVPATKCAS